ncbi:hypothetical protein O6P43_025786 [Quillaja saponaria]|uniref:Uncharacterized protein n=1 Tax=Quillaja saponaria TaxID=32244 RepID=A0AAD7PG02_QUISA|nr:hypothetical protein O6P43_025786 [Quillaja saponaria]
MEKASITSAFLLLILGISSFSKVSRVEARILVDGDFECTRDIDCMSIITCSEEANYYCDYNTCECFGSGKQDQPAVGFTFP